MKGAMSFVQVSAIIVSVICIFRVIWPTLSPAPVWHSVDGQVVLNIDSLVTAEMISEHHTRKGVSTETGEECYFVDLPLDRDKNGSLGFGEHGLISQIIDHYNRKDRLTKADDWELWRNDNNVIIGVKIYASSRR